MPAIVGIIQGNRHGFGGVGQSSAYSLRSPVTGTQAHSPYAWPACTHARVPPIRVTRLCSANSKQARGNIGHSWMIQPSFCSNQCITCPISPRRPLRPALRRAYAPTSRDAELWGILGVCIVPCTGKSLSAEALRNPSDLQCLT